MDFVAGREASLCTSTAGTVAAGSSAMLRSQQRKGQQRYCVQPRPSSALQMAGLLPDCLPGKGPSLTAFSDTQSIAASLQTVSHGQQSFPNQEIKKINVDAKGGCSCSGSGGGKPSAADPPWGWGWV